MKRIGLRTEYVYRDVEGKVLYKKIKIKDDDGNKTFFFGVHTLISLHSRKQKHLAKAAKLTLAQQQMERLLGLNVV